MASQSYYAEGQQVPGGAYPPQPQYGNQQQYGGGPQYGNQPQGYDGQAQYGNQNGYQQNPPPQAAQPPPSYDTKYGEPYAQAPVEGSKFSFEQTFKIDKPKYNDLWAGILVRYSRWSSVWRIPAR